KAGQYRGHSNLPHSVDFVARVVRGEDTETGEPRSVLVREKGRTGPDQAFTELEVPFTKADLPKPPSAKLKRPRPNAGGRREGALQEGEERVMTSGDFAGERIRVKRVWGDGRASVQVLDGGVWVDFATEPMEEILRLSKPARQNPVKTPFLTTLRELDRRFKIRGAGRLNAAVGWTSPC